MSEKGYATGAAGKAKLSLSGDGVDAANGADASIAPEHLFAEIGGLRAKLPVVDAELGAKGKSSSGDLQGTPAAKGATTRAARKRFAVDPTAFHDPHNAHKFVCKSRNGLRRVE